jgi:hypothetical protein
MSPAYHVHVLSFHNFRNVHYFFIEFCIVTSIWCCDLQLATEESKNFRDRNAFITLVPNKALLQKAQEPPKKKDKSAADEVSAGVWAHASLQGVLIMEHSPGTPDHIL